MRAELRYKVERRLDHAEFEHGRRGHRARRRHGHDEDEVERRGVVRCACRDVRRDRPALRGRIVSQPVLDRYPRQPDPALIPPASSSAVKRRFLHIEKQDVLEGLLRLAAVGVTAEAG